MSEDRVLAIFAEKRNLPIPADEEREGSILPDRRVLDVQDEERVLEVWLP